LWQVKFKFIKKTRKYSLKNLGWGFTEKNSISEVPMYISAPVVDDADCLRSNALFSKLSSRVNFCAGGKSGQTPCKGIFKFKK
jgi:hypothetical protein